MGVYTWHAAKLRLTGILFPIGFVAMVRAGSPDRPVPYDRWSPSARPPARHLGIQGLKAGAGKSLEKSEKRAVQAARNGPSADRQYWQRFELGIQGLKNWGRNWSRKVRETRSSSSRKRPEPAAHPCRGPGGQAGDEHGGSPSFKGTRGRGTRVPVPATGSGEPLGTDAEPGPSLSDGVPGPSHPPGGCSVTRPPTCRVTKPRAWSRTPILNRFASLLAGG